MALRRSLALWLLALAVGLAPSLGVAVQVCDGCCCPPAGHESGGGCETAVTGVVCCDAAPVYRHPPAQSSHWPALNAIAPERPTFRDPRVPVCAPARSGDLPSLVSPLRLSVVLRI